MMWISLIFELQGLLRQIIKTNVKRGNDVEINRIIHRLNIHEVLSRYILTIMLGLYQLSSSDGDVAIELRNYSQDFELKKLVQVDRNIYFDDQLFTPATPIIIHSP